MELSRVALPGRLLRHLDLGSLRVLPDAGVDRRLRAWHTDLLLRALTKGGRPALVYLVLEHKSSPDPRTPYQLLRYLCRIWDAWTSRKENRRWTRLPPIIPVVLSQGRTPWRRSLEFSRLVEWPGGQEAEACTPRFCPILLDLARRSDTDLGADPGVRLDERELFGPVVQYVLRARQGQLSRGTLEALPPEKRRKAMTIAESLERKGMLEGRILPKRETLERQSARKLGLTPAERQAIRSVGSAKKLDATLDAVVSARSKAAVLRHLGTPEPTKTRAAPRVRASGRRPA